MINSLKRGGWRRTAQALYHETRWASSRAPLVSIILSLFIVEAFNVIQPFGSLFHASNLEPLICLLRHWKWKLVSFLMPSAVDRIKKGSENYPSRWSKRVEAYISSISSYS